MTSGLVQIVMASFGLAALALALSANERCRRWAPVIGLVGQPAWFWFALTSAAWGLFTLTVAYTLVFAYGARVQWRGHEPTRF